MPSPPGAQPCQVLVLLRAAQRLGQPQHPGDDHGLSTKTSPSQDSTCICKSISSTSIRCWSVLQLLGAERFAVNPKLQGEQARGRALLTPQLMWAEAMPLGPHYKAKGGLFLAPEPD